MEFIRKIISNPVFDGIVSLVAVGVMMFTPDHVDKIIETGLSLFGIKKLWIREQ